MMSYGEMFWSGLFGAGILWVGFLIGGIVTADHYQKNIVDLPRCEEKAAIALQEEFGI